MVPLVSVRAPNRFISSPEHNVMFPSVVVMAATAFKFRLRPALNKTLPLVVVMAAFTLISRPQHAKKFPLVAVIAAFTLTSRTAFKRQSGCARGRRPADRVVYEDVAGTTCCRMKSRRGRGPGDRSVGPSCCSDVDAVRYQQRGKCCAGDVASGADGEILRIDKPSAGLPLGGGGGNFCLLARYSLARQRFRS